MTHTAPYMRSFQKYLQNAHMRTVSIWTSVWPRILKFETILSALSQYLST